MSSYSVGAVSGTGSTSAADTSTAQQIAQLKKEEQSYEKQLTKLKQGGASNDETQQQIQLLQNKIQNIQQKIQELQGTSSQSTASAVQQSDAAQQQTQQTAAVSGSVPANSDGTHTVDILL